MNRILALCPLLVLVGCTDAATVTIQWTFAGLSCADAAVNNVTVQIGPTTVTVPCTDPGTGVDGATIGGIPGGTQAYSLNATGSIAYESTGSFSVLAGLDNNVGLIDLSPVTSTGSVTFHWAFTSASYSCAYANVTTMKVQVGGLEATVGCYDPVSQGQGITIAGVPAGSQPFTLTASTPTYDAYGNFVGNVPYYSATGTVTVSGGVDNDTGVIQLDYITPPQGTANSNIVFLWSFAGQTCAATPQVKQVQVQISDPSSPVNVMVACNTNGTDGIQVQQFAAGTYPFTLTGLDSTGTAVFQAGGSISVDGVTSVNVNVSLAPVGSPASGPGNAQISFTLGASGQNCQQVNVDSLHFTLSDSTGAAVSGSDLIVGCMTSSGLTTQVQFNALTGPAVYYLSAQGLNGGNVTYSGNFQFSVAPMLTSGYQIVIPQVQ